MIALIDYEAGNLHSVTKALEKVGAGVLLTDKPEDVDDAEKILLPGVGHFGNAIEALKARGLIGPLRNAVAQQKPFLGICVGMQLLFESSDESPGTEGLAVLKGHVKRFPSGLKVPHLGWNQVIQQANSPLWNDIPNGSFFYFAHSFYTVPKDKQAIAGKTEYQLEYASSLHQHNLFGCQFHPEKSQKWGLKVLENFVSI